MKINDVEVGHDYCTDLRMYGGRRVRVTEIVTTTERTHGYGGSGTRQVRVLKVDELDPATGELVGGASPDDETTPWRRRGRSLTGQTMPARELAGPWDDYAEQVLDQVRRTDLGARMADALAATVGDEWGIEVTIARAYSKRPEVAQVNCSAEALRRLLHKAGITIAEDDGYVPAD